MPLTPILELHGVSWTYRPSAWATPQVALHPTRLAVRPGEALCVVGPNGAGKTTLLMLAAGLRRPHSGDALMKGFPVHDPGSKARMGVLFEGAPLPGRLTVRAALALLAQLTGPPWAPADVEDVLSRLDLHAVADRRVDTLSTGTRQRVALAQALLHRPDVLLLDEPLKALDPTSAQRVAQVLSEERQHGAALIVATHRPLELLSAMTHIARIDEGRLGPIEPVDPRLARAAADVLRSVPHVQARP